MVREFLHPPACARAVYEITLPPEVVQFLSHAFARINEHELYSPSGESSLSEERGNPDC